MPDVFAVARQLVWESRERQTILGAYRRVESAVVPTPEFRWWANHVLVIEIAGISGPVSECALIASYRGDDMKEFSPTVELPIVRADRPMLYQIGTMPLDLSSAGILRLEGRCPVETTFTINRVSIYAALGAVDYRARLMHETLKIPVER